MLGGSNPQAFLKGTIQITDGDRYETVPVLHGFIVINKLDNAKSTDKHRPSRRRRL